MHRQLRRLCDVTSRRYYLFPVYIKLRNNDSWKLYCVVSFKMVRAGASDKSY